jgi:hypothetical protein
MGGIEAIGVASTDTIRTGGIEAGTAITITDTDTDTDMDTAEGEGEGTGTRTRKKGKREGTKGEHFCC